MKISIIGASGSGKTYVFRILVYEAEQVFYSN